jgi:predicted ATPase
MAWQLLAFDRPSGREMCDFSSASPTVRLYACRNLSIPRAEHVVFLRELIGAWAACARCAALIDAGYWSQLTDRSLRQFMNRLGVSRYEQGEVLAQLAEIHHLFKEHMIKES